MSRPLTVRRHPDGPGPGPSGGPQVADGDSRVRPSGLPPVPPIVALDRRASPRRGRFGRHVILEDPVGQVRRCERPRGRRGRTSRGPAVRSRSRAWVPASPGRPSPSPGTIVQDRVGQFRASPRALGGRRWPWSGEEQEPELEVWQSRRITGPRIDAAKRRLIDGPGAMEPPEGEGAGMFADTDRQQAPEKVRCHLAPSEHAPS